MPTNPLVGALTPQVRQAVYLTLVGLGVVYAILGIVYETDPAWLDKAGEVLAYLGTLGLGTLAASNISKGDGLNNSDELGEG